MIPSHPIPIDPFPSSISIKHSQSDQVNIPDEREEVVWEKVLWRKQPFPDNHVPPSFLSELNDIPARPRPRLINLVIAALPILQHLSTVFLFLGVFNALLDDRIGAAQLGWTCFGLGGVGYCVFRFGWGVKERDAVEGYIPHPTPLRQLILPPLLLSLLSPILKSLTSSTSSDSIWPLSGLLFVVHLLLADFSTGEDSRKQSRRRRRLREVWRVKERRASLGANGDMPKAEERRYVLEEKSLTSSLSLTSALSASIVLSSRLPTTSHVFSFILLSVLLFSGWPNIAKGVRESGKIWSIGLTGSMALLAFSFLPGYEDLGLGGDTCGVLFLGILGVVGLVGPLGVWVGWRWKTVRGGGWDAAKVTLKRRASMQR